MTFKKLDKKIKKLQETKLFEMAFKRKKLIEKIEGLQNPINEHLLKIILFDDKVNFSKHVNDLETWLLDIQEMDFLSSNKKLKSKDHFNTLFIEPISNDSNVQYIENKLRGKLKKYSKLPRRRSNEEAIIILYNLHKEISKLLSRNEIYDFFNDIENKI